MSWVIVTGANGGIGEATVHQLIKNGYSVFAADLGDAPVTSFGTYGDALFRYHPVDVTSEESVIALANAVAALDEPVTGAVLRRSAWAFRWAASPTPLILRRSTPSSSRRLPATSRCRRLSPTAAPPSKLQLAPFASVHLGASGASPHTTD